MVKVGFPFFLSFSVISLLFLPFVRRPLNLWNIESFSQSRLSVFAEELLFDFVIDCRGIGSNIKQLRAVRGEVLHVHCPEVKIKHAIRFMHPRYKIYIVPRQNDRYIIGATEIESDDKSPMSLQSMLELGSALYAIHPAFAESRIIEIDSNLRPAMMDNNPVIQIGNNKMSVNGLYRHGFLLLPEVLNTIMNVLENKAHQYSWMVKHV